MNFHLVIIPTWVVCKKILKYYNNEICSQGKVPWAMNNSNRWNEVKNILMMIQCKDSFTLQYANVYAWKNMNILLAFTVRLLWSQSFSDTCKNKKQRESLFSQLQKIIQINYVWKLLRLTHLRSLAWVHDIQTTKKLFSYLCNHISYWRKLVVSMRHLPHLNETFFRHS